MDSESDRSRKLQCWDGPAIVSSFVTQWAASQGDLDFEPDDSYCDALINIGFNECTDETRKFWHSTIKSNYRGEEGRRRIRMAAINLAERGGLHLRLSDVRCPVRWLHVSILLGGRDRVLRPAIGNQGCRVLGGQRGRRDPNVRQLDRCPVGASGGRRAFFELLSCSRGQPGDPGFSERIQIIIITETKFA